MAVTSDGKTEARANVSKGNIFSSKKKVERLVVTSILSEKKKKKVSEGFYFQYIYDDESVYT